MDETREGSCRCGRVRFSVTGEPLRIGLCHCTDCRKESGSAFVYFGVWPRDAFRCEGTVATWEGRSFCPICGSRVFTQGDDAEAEVRLGALADAPVNLPPVYEVWAKRREPWLPEIPGVERHAEDNPSA